MTNIGTNCVVKGLMRTGIHCKRVQKENKKEATNLQIYVLKYRT